MDESELFPLHFILYVFGVYIAKINCIYHGLPACMFTANKKKNAYFGFDSRIHNSRDFTKKRLDYLFLLKEKTVSKLITKSLSF